jgi:diguanylate cyclase (GGDEF)-like protein
MGSRSDAATSIVEHLQSAFRATGVLLAVVVVLNAAVFAYLLGWLGPDLESAIDDARLVREMHEAMLDQETGLRGFLLTGEQALLEPYADAQGVLAETTAAAEGGLADRGSVAADFLEMRLAQQRWAEQWAEPAAAGPEFGSDAERAAFIEAGKLLFDDYRVPEEAVLDQLLEERTQLLDRQRAVLAATALAALATGALLFLVARRERRRLHHLLVEPIQELETTIERLQRGDLDARAAPGGATELDGLGRALDAMATDLASALERGREQTEVLAARSARQGQILSMARDIAGSLNLRYVMRAVTDSACKLADPSLAVLWLLDDEESRLVEAWRQAESASSPAGTQTLELGQALAGEVARDGRAKTADERGEPHVAVELDAPATGLAIPMIVGARVVGVVEVQFAPARTVDAELVVMLETLGSHGGTAIEAARLHETATELSQVDALTRLLNRRRLDTDLETEVARATRYQRPLAFVMADVDHFKTFNDTFGHQRGDEVLQEVARLLGQAVRASDTVYRYGGEELAIILRETAEAPAADLAERLRAAIEGHFGSRPGMGGVTMSLGVSALDHAAIASPEDLIRTADEALYAAKRAGRNRVARAGADTAAR